MGQSELVRRHLVVFLHFLALPTPERLEPVSLRLQCDLPRSTLTIFTPSFLIASRSSDLTNSNACLASCRICRLIPLSACKKVGRGSFWPVIDTKSHLRMLLSMMFFVLVSASLPSSFAVNYPPCRLGHLLVHDLDLQVDLSVRIVSIEDERRALTL